MAQRPASSDLFAGRALRLASWALLCLSAGVASAADVPDTGCAEESRPVDATYADGACVTPEMATVCEETKQCPTWESLVARVSGNARWTLVDCTPESDVAHRAVDAEVESSETLDFNAEGALVAEDKWLYLGTPWCCDGQSAYHWEIGPVGGTCLVSEEGIDSGVGTSDSGGVKTVPGPCGCSMASGGAPAWGVLLFLLGVLRRPR